MEMDLILWLVAFIIFALVEAFTSQLVTIWFAAGSLMAFILALFNTPLWLQAVVFVIVSVILLIFTRPAARKLLFKKPVPTNADALIGQKGIVLERIDNLEQTGRIHISGLDWSALSKDGTPISKGSIVEVVGIEGVKAVVIKTEGHKKQQEQVAEGI